MPFSTAVEYGMAQIHSAMFWCLCWHAVGRPPSWFSSLPIQFSPFAHSIWLSNKHDVNQPAVQHACRCSLYNNGPGQGTAHFVLGIIPGRGGGTGFSMGKSHDELRGSGEVPRKRWPKIMNRLSRASYSACGERERSEVMITLLPY